MPPDRTRATPRNPGKLDAIRDAARELFLRDGFAATSMDDVAALARVSKQTVYAHFTDKEALFTTVIVERIEASAAETHDLLARLDDTDDLATALRRFAAAHAAGILDPSVIALRRIVIGEASRFPDLARTWWEHGPQAGHETLAAVFRRAADRGRLRPLPDPSLAAQHFNWLVLSIPMNATLLLGDAARFSDDDLRYLADEAVRVFLAAYGPVAGVPEGPR